MHRRSFLSRAASVALLASRRGSAQSPAKPQQIHPGVFKFTLGTPEKITPVTTRHYPPATAGFDSLPEPGACPIAITGAASRRGYLISVPLEPREAVYGLGLQLQSFMQRGLKKKLRVNADPKMDTGDSHAPVPFYVTTRGYGILIDTARYATFYCGNKRRKGGNTTPKSAPEPGQGVLPAAYSRFHLNDSSEVLVDIPAAAGADVYVFAGPSMRAAVQRYNLFSGGGALPPRWGLGVWYRCEKDYAQEDVLRLAAEFRDHHMPCDVIGLEPGWQTHAYSCTFVWSDRFPDPAAMTRKLVADHYRLNVWEHAFTNPSSPIYGELVTHSADYEVWGGAVPDFLQAEARRIFGGFHDKEHVARGVAGYKLDECDNSDFTGNWSFPEVAAFPSGADGEQMHSLFGLRYQDAIQSIFEKRQMRTYGLVRSSGALAAPYPYVLYSDLYDHPQFIRGVANMGFSGLLWTPELRNAKDEEDLVRRLQSAVFSPMALINAWYIKHPPWKQVDRAANNAGQLARNWEHAEALCRSVMQLRMRFLPYLYAAFVQYYQQGLPPFRPLVMDHPGDPQTWTIDNQYWMGDSLIVAPVVAGESTRSVYLPAGDWFDYWTGRRQPGGQHVDVQATLEQIPLFVKDGSVLPLAEPALYADDPASWQIRATVYGSGPATATLYEDDGELPPNPHPVNLNWNAATRSGSVARSAGNPVPRYEVIEWRAIS